MSTATIDQATRIERLRQLRRVVESVPARLFNMRSFAEIGPYCGTIGCAAGHAAMDPWFRTNTPIIGCFEWTKKSLPDLLVVEAVDRNSDTIDMLASEVFGIDTEDASRLFATDSGDYAMALVTQAQVVANIDRLIAGHPAEVYVTEDED